MHNNYIWAHQMILEFLHELTQSGYRIFSVDDARDVARTLNLKESSISYILKSLISKKAIRSLFRGNYAIEDNFLSGPPLHPFEIALHLAKRGAICCWSAMTFHKLTDQVLTKIYVYSPQEKGRALPLYTYQIDGYNFHLIQVSSKTLWGIERRRTADIKIPITDLERTLIDGLTYPHYCGGLREVLEAFKLAQDQFSIDKLMDYARHSPVVIQKRLGWICDQLSISNTLEVRTTYYDKLDPAGPRRGKYNKKWMLVENF